MVRPASRARVISVSRTDSAARAVFAFLSNAASRGSNSLTSGWNWDLAAMARESMGRKLKGTKVEGEICEIWRGKRKTGKKDEKE